MVLFLWIGHGLEMGFRRVFPLLGPLLRAVADTFRPMWDLCDPQMAQGASEDTGGTENGRAAMLLLRIAARLGLNLRCRRRAYVLARAYARDGRSVRLRFGVRSAGADEASACGLAGHVWVEPEGCESESDAYHCVVTPHDDDANRRWRRG